MIDEPGRVVWEFRYVINHVSESGKPRWSEWTPVAETGEHDSRWPQGHRVDAYFGSAMVQFRHKPIRDTPCSGGT
jgi:hypothetical protein